MAVADRRRAKKAADELRAIAGLLEQITVAKGGKAHPEMEAILQSLESIRRGLSGSVERGHMTPSERDQVADGFSGIGRALGGN